MYFFYKFYDENKIPLDPRHEYKYWNFDPNCIFVLHNVHRQIRIVVNGYKVIPTIF